MCVRCRVCLLHGVSIRHADAGSALERSFQPATEVAPNKGLQVPMTSDDQGETTTQAELHFETCRNEPLLDPEKECYDSVATRAGMETELQAMKDFGVYGDVSTSGNKERYLADALPKMWVTRPKGIASRCRLVC